MAFSAVLRRTTLNASLLAGVTVARSFQIQLSTLLQTQPPRSLFSRKNLECSPLVPFALANFSSKANKPSSDADLLRVIDTEIKCAEECDDHDRVEEIPEVFPFEIQNEMGKSTITLKRNHHGEKIEVLVSMPSLVTGEEPEHDRRVDRDDDEGEKERPSQSSIPLTINLRKNEGHGLEFCCTAYPDELVIDSMSFREAKESDEEMLAYQGPDFRTQVSFSNSGYEGKTSFSLHIAKALISNTLVISPIIKVCVALCPYLTFEHLGKYPTLLQSDLDENLQKSFYKYLELRGISAMTTNFLHEYMINKDSREYLLWLRDLKKLIEK